MNKTINQQTNKRRSLLESTTHCCCSPLPLPLLSLPLARLNLAAPAEEQHVLTRMIVAGLASLMVCLHVPFQTVAFRMLFDYFRSFFVISTHTTASVRIRMFRAQFAGAVLYQLVLYCFVELAFFLGCTFLSLAALLFLFLVYQQHFNSCQSNQTQFIPFTPLLFFQYTACRCNERLQGWFNSIVMRNEQEELVREAVLQRYVPIPLPDNSFRLISFPFPFPFLSFLVFSFSHSFSLFSPLFCRVLFCSLSCIAFVFRDTLSLIEHSQTGIVGLLDAASAVNAMTCKYVFFFSFSSSSTSGLFDSFPI